MGCRRRFSVLLLRDAGVCMRNQRKDAVRGRHFSGSREDLGDPCVWVSDVGGGWQYGELVFDWRGAVG